MMTDSTDSALASEHLSALIDGELDDAQIAQTCGHWRSDPEVRASWHAWQLIGDALRSEDLCSAPGHDAAFLGALRRRLADEPVVFAPNAVVASAAVAEAAAATLPNATAGRGWRAPAAVAAGVVMVVGVVFASRLAAPGADGPALAGTGTAGPVVATSSTRDAAAPVVPSVPTRVDSRADVASGKLIRDVRLDRYLSAHKEFAGTSALGVPSGFLRNATAEAAER